MFVGYFFPLNFIFILFIIVFIFKIYFNPLHLSYRILVQTLLLNLLVFSGLFRLWLQSFLLHGAMTMTDSFQMK